MFLKVGLSVFCYLAFTLYTVPMYKNVRAYVDEKMTSTTKTIVLGTTAITVDVADTLETRAQGLSGRKELKDHEGMFFIFEEVGLHGIWMKDMNFSIDIIWFDEYAEIIHIAQDIKPSTYPEVFTPPTKSKYVLEVPAGFVKQEGIKLGDKIDLY